MDTEAAVLEQFGKSLREIITFTINQQARVTTLLFGGPFGAFEQQICNKRGLKLLYREKAKSLQFDFS